MLANVMKGGLHNVFKQTSVAKLAGLGCGYSILNSLSCRTRFFNGMERASCDAGLPKASEQGLIAMSNHWDTNNGDDIILEGRSNVVMSAWAGLLFGYPGLMNMYWSYCVSKTHNRNHVELADHLFKRGLIQFFGLSLAAAGVPAGMAAVAMGYW